MAGASGRVRHTGVLGRRGVGARARAGARAALDEPAPHAPSPEYVLPDRTETGRPAVPERRVRAPAHEDDRGRRARGGRRRPAIRRAYERRPRSPQDRAARREQRRRQLRRRRIVALAILIAIVVLIVVLIVRGCGGSDAAAGDGSPALRGRTLPGGSRSDREAGEAARGARRSRSRSSRWRPSPAAAAAGRRRRSTPSGVPPAPAPGVRAWAAGESGVLLVTVRRRRQLEAPEVLPAAARRGRDLLGRAERLARHRRRDRARDHRRRRRLDRRREGRAGREGDRRDGLSHRLDRRQCRRRRRRARASPLSFAPPTAARPGRGPRSATPCSPTSPSPTVRHGVLIALDRIWSTRDGGRTWRPAQAASR